jgi:O-acetyl-ADP-ribose deacetylase
MKTGSTDVRLVRGDITKQTVDVIVNAANPSLMGGGGVDGAIHLTGGPAIMEACEVIRARHGKCATGHAVITTAGDLDASHVIHTVGPIWFGGEQGEPVLLAACYRRSLELAVETGAKTIAFPSISTGAYGYPVASAAAIALRTVTHWARDNPSLEAIRFVLFSDHDFATYQKALGTMESGA